MALKQCPECKKEVSAAAEACPSCGHPINPKAKWSPGVAAILSLLIPGAGQMYKGHVFDGLAWLTFVVVGYFFFIFPGLILHLLCVLSAASGNNKK